MRSPAAARGFVCFPPKEFGECQPTRHFYAGKPFPDGAGCPGSVSSVLAVQSVFAIFAVPATQHDADFMVKDSKRFADSGGWGWGAFEYDAASGTDAKRCKGTMPVRLRVPQCR